MGIRDTKPASFKVHEAVKGDVPFQAKIDGAIAQMADSFCASAEIHVLYITGNGLMENTVLFVALFKCSKIQISHIPEYTIDQKVLFYRAN